MHWWQWWYLVDRWIYVLFAILFYLLIALVVRNFMQGQALVGLNEFILIGFLIFLAIGQEFVSLGENPQRPSSLGGKILVNVLSALGRREEALAAAQEVVDIRRDLARARPEAFTPDLAMSLNILANVLSALGRREEALAAAQEAEHLRVKK
jgi:tetratricopeptide (TPR) repeat protein